MRTVTGWAKGSRKPIPLEVGDRIYYTGDMANRDGWGTITALALDVVSGTPTRRLPHA